MYILHVCLGDPYCHQGGLNLYCRELVEEQRRAGNRAAILYPGTFIHSRHPVVIRTGRDKYEILDALPVAITYGIDIPERYMVPADKKIFLNFLQRQKPDMIHIHSVQGIHIELFEAAKELHIPMLFTTHDYYLICRKCILIDRSDQLCSGGTSEKCAGCNAHSGLSATKQRVIQSTLYQACKNSAMMQRVKKTAASEKTEQSAPEPYIPEHPEMYAALQDYYTRMQSLFDLIHCNSTVSYNVYHAAFPTQSMEIVPITHKGLKREKHERFETCRITYMGGESAHKGYPLLIEAVRSLCKNASAPAWQLNLYGGIFQAREIADERVCYHGYFGQDEAEQVWNSTDILVMPSQWRETFGFVLLEALCRGIPVICSDLVGAKDLNLPDLVFHYNNAQQLYEKMLYLSDPQNYSGVQERILKMELQTDMKEHAKVIQKLYTEVGNERCSVDK